MWVSLRTNASLAVVACLALTGATARADDLLVMPYACSVVDGQPTLRRARDEGHRVLGRREQRNFTACSPVNPDMCRQWTVYRFDLDCDGARVPWLSVVAAATRGQRYERVWIEEGASVSTWARAGACRPTTRARALPPTTIAGDRLNGIVPTAGRSALVVDCRYAAWLCADARHRRHLRRRRRTQRRFRTMGRPPAGVSPPSFKGTRAESPPPAPPEPAAKSARAESPPPPPALPELAAKGSRIAGFPPAPAEPSKSATGQEAAPSARPPVPLPETKQVKQAEAKPAPPPPAQSPAPAAVPGGPVIPKIINRPAPATDEASPQPPPVTTVPKAAATQEAGPKLAAIPPPRPKEAVVPDSAPQKAAVRKDDDAPATLFGAVRSPATGAAIAVGGLAVLLLAAFALTRRRERAQIAGSPRRDIATVSLDGRTGSAPVASAASKSDQDVWAQDQWPPSQPTPAEKPSMPSSWGDRIPRTRDEALQVLGMGVTPDANIAAIKKIVDGLRASWHPDHAAGNADRQMRELRLKQINAAWEIIAGKRAVV
jgi:hypothetical protein